MKLAVNSCFAIVLIAMLPLFAAATPREAGKVRVNAINYVRAETDLTFARYASQGAFGKFLHIHKPVSISE